MKIRILFLPLSAAILCFTLGACNNVSKGSTEKSSDSGLSSEAAIAAPESTHELVGLLHQAALDGDLNSVEKALESGANVNGVDEDGRTALMFAAFDGHSEIVLTLLEAEAGIDRRDLMGRTALLYAATGPFPETVRILLDKGAEPNVVDSDEHFSPLMHAAAEGNLDVVKILLEWKADPTLKDVDGDNAASFARQNGHLEVANYLDAL